MQMQDTRSDEAETATQLTASSICLHFYFVDLGPHRFSIGEKGRDLISSDLICLAPPHRISCISPSRVTALRRA